MSIRLAAIAAVVILSLAGVGAALLDPTGQRIAVVLAFLAPTIVALVAMARVQELNGEVQNLRSSIKHATDNLAPAVRDAAEKMQQAAPVVSDAADKVQEAAPIVGAAADKVQEAAPIISDAAARAEHAAEQLPHDEPPHEPPAGAA